MVPFLSYFFGRKEKSAVEISKKLKKVKKICFWQQKQGLKVGGSNIEDVDTRENFIPGHLKPFI